MEKLDRKWRMFRNFVALQLLDAWTTYHLIVTQRGVEGNPVFNWVGGNWWIMAGLKVGLTFVLWYMLFREEDSYEAQKVAAAASFAMLGVVGWNLFVMLG